MTVGAASWTRFYSAGRRRGGIHVPLFASQCDVVHTGPAILRVLSPVRVTHGEIIAMLSTDAAELRHAAPTKLSPVILSISLVAVGLFCLLGLALMLIPYVPTEVIAHLE